MGKRKHIPILAKCLAARRQLKELGVEPPRRPRRNGRVIPKTEHFEMHLLPILEDLLGKPLQLDHDPALGLRQQFKNGRGEIVRYVPAEDDWRYLTFRQKAGHLEKTVGRKPGAEKTVTTKGSDIWLMKKYRRLEGPPKRKVRIPSRGFPKIKRSFR